MRSILWTTAAAALLAMPAAAQQDEVKGWVSKPKPVVEQPVVQPPPAEQPVVEQPVAEPPAPEPPKSIVRGKDDPAAPAVVVNPPQTEPEQPAIDPPIAQGGRLSAVDPAAIQQAMLNAGHRADLTTDNDGNPLIISETSRSQYWVMFLDCAGGTDCLAVEFYVGYTVEQKTQPDVLNDFNVGFRYVKAYFSGGVVSMSMDVLMRDGGIEEATFLEYLRLWTVIMPEWETAMGV